MESIIASAEPLVRKVIQEENRHQIHLLNTLLNQQKQLIADLGILNENLQKMAEAFGYTLKYVVETGRAMPS